MSLGKTSNKRHLLQIGLLVAIALIGVLYWQYREAISLQNLAQQETVLRSFKIEHPALTYGLAFLLYVVITGFSLPGAAIMTLAFGWYFGFLRAVVLVSFASTLGATLAFLMSRTLFREAIQQRFGHRLGSFNENLQREGAFYLFTLRLIPAVPFFVINAVMGLTPMRAKTFWWVSQIGMLPGTAVYVYAGSTFPTLHALSKNGPGGIISLPMLAAFAILGLFPLVARKAIAYYTGRVQL